MSHKNSLIKIQDLLENTGSKSFLKRMVYFLGPGFIASIAYIDPGNFATNIESGSKFGYTLLWVILFSNLAAILGTGVISKSLDRRLVVCLLVGWGSISRLSL